MEILILTTIYYIIVVLGSLALLRHALFMIGSAVYEMRRRRLKAPKIYPTLTVVIPAHNEERTIIKTVSSVLGADYEHDKLQVIVIDDGSSDKTLQLLQTFEADNPDFPVTVMTQKNQGKAHAMNNAMRDIDSELVMTLDADSTLDVMALKNAAKYFTDPDVVGVPANVRIRRDGTLFNLIQYYEYFTGWQAKRAMSVFSIEYIIGGVASTFRTKALREVGFYDTDTLVEDMDLTVKLVKKDGHDKFMFGSDVIAYTEHVLTFRDLLKQRYRWKYGHLQTLTKHRDMFFSRRKDIPKSLSWVYLPYIVFSELVVFMEPVFHVFVLYLLFAYGDFITFCTSTAAITTAISVYIFAEHSAPWKERAKMALAAPAIYIMFFMLTAVWYISLLRTWSSFPSILRGRKADCKWEHVARSEQA